MPHSIALMLVNTPLVLVVRGLSSCSVFTCDLSQHSLCYLSPIALVNLFENSPSWQLDIQYRLRIWPCNSPLFSGVTPHPHLPLCVCSPVCPYLVPRADDSSKEHEEVSHGQQAGPDEEGEESQKLLKHSLDAHQHKHTEEDC